MIWRNATLACLNVQLVAAHPRPIPLGPVNHSVPSETYATAGTVGVFKWPAGRVIYVWT